MSHNDPTPDITLAQLEQAERRDRAEMPVLWWAAQIVVSILAPVETWWHWRKRKAIGYHGRPR